MKKFLYFVVVLSLVVTTGLFTFTPASSAKANESESVVVQAPDTIYISGKFFPGNVRDYIFYSEGRDGQNYRGYLVLDYVITGGAIYAGQLFRAPLPYPEYNFLPEIE